VRTGCGRAGLRFHTSAPGCTRPPWPPPALPEPHCGSPVAGGDMRAAEVLARPPPQPIACFHDHTRLWTVGRRAVESERASVRLAASSDGRRRNPQPVGAVHRHRQAAPTPCSALGRNRSEGRAITRMWRRQCLAWLTAANLCSRRLCAHAPHTQRSVPRTDR